ncbi:hypothetical protein D3C78_1337470 [compost metagenome]
MGEGVDGDVQLAVVAMDVLDRFLQLFLGKVEAGKVARVGIIFQADIHGVGTVIYRSLQGRQVTGGTKQLHRFILTQHAPMADAGCHNVYR